MLIRSNYSSPLGGIDIVVNDTSVKGVWFDNQTYYGATYDLSTIRIGENKIIAKVKKWLDDYFLGNNPTLDASILDPELTAFRKKVLMILAEIPYGETITYKDIVTILERKEKGKKSSARAVGGAVGHNPIAILIPCHRVVGSDGALTGYAGGIDRKIELLALEGMDRKKLEHGKI